MKILVVDDDESILSVLDHALSVSNDCDVTLASSAKDALEKIDIAASAFDCFLIDIQMPEVDGIHLTQVIRQTPGYELPPILMLTAMRDRSYLDRAFVAGATDYVSKPFDFKNLRSRIFDAQMLVLERAQSLDKCKRGKGIIWSRGIPRDPEADQIIEPGNVNGLIADAEFDNYVLEQARRPRCKGRVIALKIADPTLGNLESSFDEFSSLLHHAMTCMNAAFPNLLSAVSYRGNGVFLCMTKRDLNVSNGMIENAINPHFTGPFVREHMSQVRVFAGLPIPIKASSDTGVFDILWSATDSVERRFASQTRFKSISKRLLQRSLQSEEQVRLEKKAYKSVMRDMLADMNNDRWLRKLHRG